jgi:hypothetical protein
MHLVNRGKSLRIALAASAALLGACQDQPESPVAPEIPIGRAVRAEAPPTSGSHGDRLRQLIQTRDSIHLEGTWVIDESLHLDSNTHLTGAPGATIRWTDDTWNLSPFYAEGVSGVTISGLTFEGAAGGTHVRHQFVLKIHDGHNITFSNNYIRKIALVGSSTPNDVFPTAWSQLNSNINILNNTVLEGVCGASRIRVCEPNDEPAIELGYVTGATITGNTLSNYGAGVVIWGGDPSDHVQNHDSLMAGNSLVEDNTIREVGHGIGIFRSQNVDVIGNDVQHCWDMCLDVEGGYDIVFHDNTAKYGGHYVAAVYWNTEQANFNWNRLHKSATFTNMNGDVESSQTDQLYYNASAPDSTINNVNVQLHNNYLEWEGTGTGKVSLGHSRNFMFNNNTLKDVVVDLAESPIYGGTVDVSGNTMTFTRTLGSSYPAAIRVGYNNVRAGPGTGIGCTAGPVLYGYWHVIVAGNSISSTGVSQSGTGIDVFQDCSTATLQNLIENNQIRHFPVAIRTQGDTTHHFAIVNNGHTGSLDYTGSYNPNVSGNYAL